MLTSLTAFAKSRKADVVSYPVLMTETLPLTGTFYIIN